MGKVLFSTQDDGGSAQYRCHYPAEALRQRGHRAVVASTVTASWAQDGTVVMQRPFSPGALRRIEALQAMGSWVLVDWDDDYLNVNPSDDTTWRYYQQPDVRTRVQKALSVADGVVCASDRLAEVAREHNEHVFVVPNGLPARFLNHPIKSNPRDSRTVVGWAGTPGTAAEFRIMAKSVRAMLRETNRVLLRTVGLNPAWVRRLICEERNFPVDPAKLDCVPWIDGHDEYMSICGSFDVWLAPYRDTPFNQAKYPTKALEAAFLGIPTLASDIEPYRVIRAREDKPQGILIPMEHQWGGAIRTMVMSPPTRRMYAANARDWASLQTAEHLAQQWEAVLWPG